MGPCDQTVSGARLDRLAGLFILKAVGAQAGDPELVRAIDLAVPGTVREDWLVVIAVGRG